MAKAFKARGLTFRPVDGWGRPVWSAVLDEDEGDHHRRAVATLCRASDGVCWVILWRDGPADARPSFSQAWRRVEARVAEGYKPESPFMKFMTSAEGHAARAGALASDRDRIKPD